MGLFTVQSHEHDMRSTYQVEASSAGDALRAWATSHVSACPDLSIELLEPDERNLGAPTQNLLFLLPLEGLKSIWYFYGGIGEKLVAGDLIATVE